MIRVRDAVPEDVPQLLAIYNEAVRSSTATFDLEEQTLEERLEWFSTFGEKYPLIVAETEQEIIGYCSLSPFNKKPAYKHTVELSIYLSPSHREEGVALLMQKSLSGRQQQCSFHHFFDYSGNTPSIKLHQNLAFNLPENCARGNTFERWLDVEYYQLLVMKDSYNVGHERKIACLALLPNSFISCLVFKLQKPSTKTAGECGSDK